MDDNLENQNKNNQFQQHTKINPKIQFNLPVSINPTSSSIKKQVSPLKNYKQ
jgi:hypothetical protein